MVLDCTADDVVLTFVMQLKYDSWSIYRGVTGLRQYFLSLVDGIGQP